MAWSSTPVQPGTNVRLRCGEDPAGLAGQGPQDRDRPRLDRHKQPADHNRLPAYLHLTPTERERIVGSLWNTVLITAPSTVLVVALDAFAAYALAWIDFPGRDVVFIVVVALIVVPVQVAIIPDATIFRHLGIYGDIPAVIALHVAFRLPFAIFLFRNFFIGIPCDLLEATRMDGATEFGVFRLVVLPIGWPAIASLAIFQFLWVWNDLLVALVFATSDNGPMTQPTAERLLRVPAVLRTGRARRLRQVALANDSIDVCPLWRLPPGDRSGK